MANPLIDNRYRIIKSLNKGATGEVLHVFDLLENEERAVKVLQANTETDEYLQEFFNREVEALKRLEHPNIVKLYGQGCDGKDYKSNYLVLEYVEGQNLDEYVSGEPVIIDTAFEFAIQLLEALSFAHSKHIYHRDIKPGNVLVDSSEKIKLVDFGVSKVYQTLRKGLTVRNFLSIPYAAPEQLSNRPSDARTDIYSVGAVLYMMLTGKDPDPERPLYKVVGESQLDKEIIDILFNMVAENPDQRSSSTPQTKNILQTYIKKHKKQNIDHYVGITDAVIRDMQSIGFINDIDPDECLKVLHLEFSKDVYVAYNKNHDRYEITGRQLKLSCKLDNRDGKYLVATKLFHPSPLNLEIDKENALSLFCMWKFIRSPQSPPSDYSVRYLLDELSTERRKMDVKKQFEVSQKDMVGQWEKVIKLQKDLSFREKKAIDYKSKKISEDGAFLMLNIGKQENPFKDEQALLVSHHQKKRPIYAGFYYDTESEGEDNLLIVGMTSETEVELIADSGEVLVDDRLNDIALSRQEKAIRAIKYNEAVNPNISRLLMNPHEAKSSKEYIQISNYFNQDIDDSKKEAVNSALQASDLFVIQGPPGTGKTTLISELVAQIVNKCAKSKVLLTSQSHVAVNHALMQISKLQPELPMIRIGRKDKVSLGAERFLYEEQAKQFAKRTKQNSDNYMVNYRKTFNIPPDMLDSVTLFEEVKSKLAAAKNLGDKLLILEEEAAKVKAVRKMVSDNNNRFNNIRAKLIRTADTIDSESQLKEALESIFDEYIEVGEQFLDTVSTNIDSITKYNTIETSIKDFLSSIEESEKESMDTCLLIADVLELSLSPTKDKLPAYVEAIQEKIEQHQDDFETIAKVEMVRKEWLKRVEAVEDLEEACVKESAVVAATCLGIASNPIVHNMEFDYVVIDEAGRATPPESLVPAVRGKRIIMVGDQKQLPPVVDYDLTNELLEGINLTREQLTITLFESLYIELPDSLKCLLKEQYRMHPAIGQLVSDAFYDSQLISKTKEEEKNHQLKWWPKSVLWHSTSQVESRFEKLSGKSRQNSYEAKHIFSLLTEIEQRYSELSKNKKVAVISGYLAQKQHLKSLIDPGDSKRWPSISIEIDTVDAFQGRETDIVIYSIVRSNENNNLGFIKDHRRLNVALSRARELLIIVGDLDFVSSAKLVGSANPFTPVIKHIKAHEKHCMIEVLS